MKTQYKLMIVGFAAVLLLAGCFAVGTFNPFLGGTADAAGDQTTETTLIGVVNVAESSSNPDGLAFVQSGVGTGLTNNAGQVLRIDFSNGLVDVTGTAITGLTVYELLLAASATGEHDRGIVVPYTATVVQNGTGSSAYLAMDLSTLTMSDPIEVEMTEAVTANGGLKLLNTDGDDVPGEADDDRRYIYPPVTGATVFPAGVPRNPQAGVVSSFPGGITLAQTDILVSGVQTPTYNDRFDNASLTPGFTIWSFEPTTMVWTQVAYTTPTAFLAGAFTMTIPAVAAGDILQVRRDGYNVRTSSTAHGFIQKQFRDQNNSAGRYTRGDLLPEGTVGDVDSLSVSAWNAEPLYADVNFGTDGDIILSTVTSTSVRFLYDDGDTITQVPYDFFVVQSGDDGNNTLRFYFSGAFEVQAGDDLEVLVYPTVMDSGVDPAVATDDYPVLDVSERIYGIGSESDTF